MTEAILFDWDGTLVDSLSSLYRANAVVMQGLGLPFDELLYRQHFASDWRVMYRRLGVPEERLLEADATWAAAFDRGRGATLFPGVQGALAGLASAGYRLGLVTAGDRYVVEPQLEEHGVGEYLEVRVFGDDLTVHKPHPEPLRRALAALGFGDRPGQATYLGDVPDDMRMARAVGTHGVGIASILGDPAELIAAGAREVATSVVTWSERLVGRLTG